MPQGAPEPPISLRRIFVQAVEPPVPPLPASQPYTEEEIENVVAARNFGAELSQEERAQLEGVIRKRIQAFSRDDAEMGYTTLIQCEIDLSNQSPVQFKPYISFRFTSKRRQ